MLNQNIVTTFDTPNLKVRVWAISDHLSEHCRYVGHLVMCKHCCPIVYTACLYILLSL